MRKLIIFTAIFICFNTNAKNTTSEINTVSEATVKKHMHYLTIEELNDESFNTIKEIIKKTFDDNSNECKGFVIKTDKGIIKFKKHRDFSKYSKKITAEKIAYKCLHDGDRKLFKKLAILIDKNLKPRMKMHKKDK